MKVHCRVSSFVRAAQGSIYQNVNPTLSYAASRSESYARARVCRRRDKFSLFVFFFPLSCFSVVIIVIAPASKSLSLSLELCTVVLLTSRFERLTEMRLHMAAMIVHCYFNHFPILLSSLALRSSSSFSS